MKNRGGGGPTREAVAATFRWPPLVGVAAHLITLAIFEHNGSTPPDTQRARSIPFVHADLNISSRTDIRHGLAGIAARKRWHHPRNSLSSHLEFHFAVGQRAFRQIFHAKIRNQVSESVHAHHNAFCHPVGSLRFRQREFLIVRDFFTHARRLPSLCKPSPHRRN